MSRKKRLRYAVVGLGHIAQVAVLPAFAHAKENSDLAALISSDRAKLRQLGKHYGIDRLYSYDEYGDALESGAINAVYIALPNHQHSSFTIRAARAGIHILCEKPMAMNQRECRAMIAAAEKNRVKLMIAYRLHFEEANLSAIELVKSGKIGEARLFSSVFTMDVKEGDIRLRAETGGGTLPDIGIYCINAARHLFGSEPEEVLAISATRKEKRFAEVEEMITATLRFPGERLATFICSFGASDVSQYRVVGTKGNLQLDPAYEYAVELERKLVVGERTFEKTFAARDQFAPELVYFSDCVLRNRQPEPSGWEGLADIRIIEALDRSATSGRPVRLQPIRKTTRPGMKQELRKPPVRKPKIVKASPPSR